MTFSQSGREKPDTWEPSGKRIKRGLYQSAAGYLINADCNGAANILRKVSGRLKFNLSQLTRGALTTPLRVHFWTAQLPRRFSAGRSQISAPESTSILSLTDSWDLSVT